MKSERLNIRLTPEEQELLRRASEASGQTITDYVLSRVLADAHDDLADRGLFEIDAPRWKELRARLDRPGLHRPELGKLLDRPRPWDDNEAQPVGDEGEPVLASSSPVSDPRPASRGAGKLPHWPENPARLFGFLKRGTDSDPMFVFNTKAGKVILKLGSTDGDIRFVPGDESHAIGKIALHSGDGALIVYVDGADGAPNWDVPIEATEP